MENLKIVIVDDHKLFSEGLKLLLDNNSFIKEIKVVSRGKELLSLLDDYYPDIVFMDIEMPEIDGIATTKLALEKNPDLKIVALSIYGDENYYTEMINAGAKGFILKNSDIVDVETAIQQVASGNNFFSPEILNRLIKGFGNKPAKSKSTDLTNREEEVLYHICKGLSNQEIADKLFLSKRTIDKHRENLLSKTNSKNTAGLVMFAVKIKS